MTAAVFTFVLLVGNVLRDILPLLLNQQATIGMIAFAFCLLIPWVCVFALPMGMLTATLLVFGRFSADQELTASRASGISLVSLITPILLMSVVLCGVSAAVNLELAPRCRVAFTDLRFKLRSSIVNLQLPERQFLEFPGYTIWIDKNRKGNLENVLVWKSKGETNTEMTIHAPRGTVERDETNKVVMVRLFDATCVWESSGQPMRANLVVPLDFGNLQKNSAKPGISDMTLRELRDELREMEQRLGSPLTMKAVSPDDPNKKKITSKKLVDPAEPIRVEIQKRLAFSLACFSFTLLGIPLGIRAHRRETNVGVAITLILVAIYYSLILITASFSTRAELIPHLLIWLPNFIFQAAGAVLLWRANRGL
jgi:lipopolysaccharide export system permease protein